MIKGIIVDYSPTKRTLVRMVLESDHGLVVVRKAANGEEAVSLCRSLAGSTSRPRSASSWRRPATVYFAPDHRHPQVGRGGSVWLRSDPPVDGHRPSVTACFASLAKTHGPAAVAVPTVGPPQTDPEKDQ